MRSSLLRVRDPPVEKLVPQLRVEAFAVAVFPRTSQLDIERVGPRVGQPSSQVFGRRSWTWRTIRTYRWPGYERRRLPFTWRCCCAYEVSFSGKFANVGQRSGSGNDDIGGREVSDFGKLVGIDQDEATGKHDRIDLVEATRERAGETPGFPAEPGGSHELHAAFLNESRTRGH
jgi:hypothetical protein